jgi:hypothetical protein
MGEIEAVEGAASKWREAASDSEVELRKLKRDLEQAQANIVRCVTSRARHGIFIDKSH